MLLEILSDVAISSVCEAQTDDKARHMSMGNIDVEEAQNVPRFRLDPVVIREIQAVNGQEL